MGWTKREFVTQAFEEVALASYVFDLQPEQLQSALRRLDAMMAAWNAKGIRLGYPLPSSPGSSDLDQETDVPDAANETIYTNLGMRIAGSMGKTVSPETKLAAKTGYDTLLIDAAYPAQQQMPSGMPAGAGHKQWRNNNTPFLDAPSDPLLTGKDGELEFN